LKEAFPIVVNLATDAEGSRFASILAGKESSAMVHVLRERDERLYSLAVIADLLGVSKATVHRLSKKEGDEHGD
jgi:hypothetical protein